MTRRPPRPPLFPNTPLSRSPDAQPKPDGIGLDALSGTQPFIMRADGRGWLFVPAGLVDGPLPTHYEPHESPIHNPLNKQQTDRKSTRLNSSHLVISYAVFCL